MGTGNKKFLSFFAHTQNLVVVVCTVSDIYPHVFLKNLKYPYVFIVASWGAPAHVWELQLQDTFIIFSAALMKVRLSVFPEVVRTLAAARDENFMKLEKEEAKTSPRKNRGLSGSLSLGQGC